MPAGYSDLPLLKKPGTRPGMKVLLINHPDDYYSLPDTKIHDQLCLMKETPDLVHLFVRESGEFENEMKN